MDFLSDIGIYHFLILSLSLFLIGLFGVAVSKHILKILISLEIMFSAATLNVATFAVYSDETHFKGGILALFIIVLSVIHIIIATAITINIFKFKQTANIENIGELKG